MTVHDQGEVLSENESNSVYNIDIENQLLLSNDDNNSKLGRVQELELLSRFESILSSKNDIKTYKFFLEKGASFSREIKQSCSMSVPSSHRSLNNLLGANLIIPLQKIRASKKIGARATLFGIEGVLETEIDAALSRYMKSYTVFYREVERIYQRTLHEIKDEEIQFSKIVNLVRANRRSRGFPSVDVANEIGYRLQKENGFKVWR